jgi:hypothetical protein
MQSSWGHFQVRARRLCRLTVRWQPWQTAENTTLEGAGADAPSPVACRRSTAIVVHIVVTDLRRERQLAETHVVQFGDAR